MKELQKQFSGKGQVKGYEFNQISASPFGYIYEKTSLTGLVTYEVFKRRENDLYVNVSYPSNKAFGKWAWEVSKLDKAYEILEQINESEKARLAIQ